MSEPIKLHCGWDPGPSLTCTMAFAGSALRWPMAPNTTSDADDQRGEIKERGNVKSPAEHKAGRG